MQNPASQIPATTIRLNGWKEIANHLGKGVRTVQRWEKQYGLPIHRIGEGQGEIIFAFTNEVARWTEEQERRRRGRPAEDLRPSAGTGPTLEQESSGTPHTERTDVGEHAALAEATGTSASGIGAARSRRAAWHVLLPAAVVGFVLVAWLASSRAAPMPVEQPASWKVVDNVLLVSSERGTLL